MQTIYVSIKIDNSTIQNRVAANALPSRFVPVAKALRKEVASELKLKPSALSWAIYTSLLQLDPVNTSDNWPVSM